MLSDARMRAHLLSALHGLRNSNTGWVPVSDMDFGGLEPVSPGRSPGDWSARDDRPAWTHIPEPDSE
jgi:hypothetical protein